MYILYSRGNTLALLELPQTLRFSEFPAAVLQLAENTAQKHSIPVLIRREHTSTFFKIDMFYLKSEFTAWEARSINNMFSLSFIRQERHETSEYTMTLLAPNSDWINRHPRFLTHGHAHIWGNRVSTKSGISTGFPATASAYLVNK